MLWCYHQFEIQILLVFPMIRSRSVCLMFSSGNIPSSQFIVIYFIEDMVKLPIQWKEIDKKIYKRIDAIILPLRGVLGEDAWNKLAHSSKKRGSDGQLIHMEYIMLTQLNESHVALCKLYILCKSIHLHLTVQDLAFVVAKVGTETDAWVNRGPEEIDRVEKEMRGILLDETLNLF